MNEKSLKVLEQYELEVVSTRRGRGSYICETNQGIKLLAQCQSSEKKMGFVNRVLEMLRQKGYPYADIAMYNKEGRLLTPGWDEETCILKDWYEGRECDIRSMADVEAAARRAAKLHKWMQMPGEAQETAKSGYVEEDLKEELERHNRELQKIYSFMRKQKQKSPFEILFLSCFALFYEQAQEAAGLLADPGLAELRAQSMAKGCLCHGTLTQHNIWFPGRGQVFIGNFDRCRYGIQTADLYQFMRKVMEKQEWAMRVGQRLLEAYGRERPLSGSERRYLYVRLLYPEKFWKLANQYYNRRKAWIPQKDEEKLKILIRQQKSRNSFLKTLE